MIQLTFNDFDEMLAFARQLLGGQALATPAAGTTAAVEEPATPAGGVPVAPGTPVPAAAPEPAPAVPVQAAVQPAVPVTPSQAPIPPVAPAMPSQAPTAPATPVMPVQPLAPPAASAVPTTQASYTLDDLARAGMTLMDSGRQGDLLQLLARFGVDALPALPQAQYGAFATALREMGAQI